MALSDDLQAELDRRIDLAERERADDPAFVDLPAADRRWLLVLLVLSLVGVAVLQAR